MTDPLGQLEEADVADLEVFVNPADLRQDLHAFVDYARQHEIKRGHRDNLIPKAHLQRLIKLMSAPTLAEGTAEDGYSDWIAHVDNLCLALKLVQYDVEGEYAGYSSSEPSYPDNYLKVDERAYGKFLAQSLPAQEAAILARHLEDLAGRGNEFFCGGPLTRSDRFDGWGSATGVVPTIPFAKVRRKLLELLGRCPCGVWFSTASLVRYLQQNDPWFLIPREVPPEARSGRGSDGRYGNFFERKRGDWGNRQPISSKDPDGFAKVEGRYIERFLEGLPLVLGYADVAYRKQKRASEIEPVRGLVAAFRVTERLRRVIHEEIAPPKVTVLPNFEVHVESLFYPAQTVAELRPWGEVVQQGLVSVLKLTKAKVAATLAADPKQIPIETLEALSGRPVPANVRQELNDWAGHSEKFVLYEGFGLLEGQPATATARPFVRETITPNLALVRTAKELFQRLEAAEEVPLFVRHAERSLAVPADVTSLLAPRVVARRSEAKPAVKLKRNVQTTLGFADPEAHAAFVKILLDAKCVVPIDRRALTISYPRKAESLVKECLQQFGQRYRIEVEELDK